MGNSAEDQREYRRTHPRTEGTNEYQREYRRTHPPTDEARDRKKEYEREYAKTDKYKKSRSERRSKCNASYADLMNSLVCLDCGTTDTRVLQWHHRDPDTRKGYKAPSSMRWSPIRLRTELEKCDALCANCHVIGHWELRKGADRE